MKPESEEGATGSGPADDTGLHENAGVEQVAPDPNDAQVTPAPPPAASEGATTPGGPPPGAPSEQHLPAQPPRYPHPGGRAPEGYYPPHYPPPGESGAPPPYPPPRGYESGPPPYGMPPPHMPGYPMYPYQPPMYPHYPGYPPPMPYGYPPPDPNMQHGQGYPPPPREEGANVGPQGGYQTSPPKKKEEEEDRKLPAREESQASEIGSASTGRVEEAEDDDIVPGAVTARLKTYIKPRVPTTQDVLDRRSRKNAQSRSRAAKLRTRITDIETMPAEDRSEEEQQIFLQFEGRRRRKNDRSRERALEKKEEIDRILAKSEKKRTKIEKQFLENALSAKKRKNEGDRLRRQRLKQMGLSSKMQKGMPPHMVPQHHGKYPPQYPPPHGYSAPHMGEIPMSPMPPMGGHHPHMQPSPGGYSPGMMPNMGYPSPQRRAAAPTGAMETPGRPSGSIPYMPPSQTFEGVEQGTPPANYDPGAASRVEQRRHPDGSMSISIGGNTASGEEQSSMNISDVSHLLLYDNGEDGEAPGQEPPNGEDSKNDVP